MQRDLIGLLKESKKKKRNDMENVKTVRMRDVRFDPSLFVNYKTGTAMDEVLCSYSGLPKGVNYMIIGDPGVGKTTVILDMLANLKREQKDLKCLFVSAEMNEIDLAIYVQRYPKFQDLDILFVEPDYQNGGGTTYENLESILESGWDVVAIDSFIELQGIIKEEKNITNKKTESLLIQLIKQQNKGENRSRLNTTFLTIQQVTKTGNFIGSNRLKHSITAMMELRLENPKNIYSDRYVVFSKHRRGDVGVRLFYDLSTTGDVFFDEFRFSQDKQIRKLQSDASRSMREYADKFDMLFSEEI